MYRYTPVIPTLRMLRQEDHDFEASLGSSASGRSVYANKYPEGLVGEMEGGYAHHDAVPPTPLAGGSGAKRKKGRKCKCHHSRPRA